jgi:5-methylcytosine-specific restriction endonuclease McrA
VKKKRYISADLRRRIRERAQYRCGYCLRAEELAGEQMTIEHIRPESLGGLTVEQNLWLACRRCNEYKGTQTHVPDLLSGKRVRLFNPRTQSWTEHFA